MKAAVRALVVWLGAVALLSACGGGGGGDGSGGASSPPPVVLGADIYPLASGDRRSLRPAGQVGGEPRSERVGAAVTIGGRTAHAVIADDGSVEYLERSAAGVFSLPGPNTDPFSAALGAVEILRFGITAGQTVVLLDRTLAFDADGNGSVDSVQVRIESTFVGLGTVDTPAGRFVDASQVRTVARTTVRLTGATGSVSFTLSADEWYASGVGLVRSLLTESGDGMAAVTTSEELVAYGVGTRRSESVAPTLVSTSPAGGLALPPGSGVRLTFSEALDPLSLDGENGLRLVDAANRAVPTTRSLQDGGRVVVLTPVTAPAEGTYRVVSGSGVTDLANNPLAATSVVLRVDTSGPRLAASSPAQDQHDVPLTGTLTLRYDEPVFAPNQTVFMRIHDLQRGSVDVLNVTISGNEVRGQLTTPLERNREYAFDLQPAVVDATGNAAPYQAAVRFRTDPGPLARPQALADGIDVHASTVADIDGDGRNDVVFVGQRIGTSDYLVGARLQQADGRFAAATELTPVANCGGRSIAVADFDGDGRADVAIATTCGVQNLIILRRLAGGGFAAESPSPAGSALAYNAQALDIDGDGRSELLVEEGGELRFLRRDNSGTWTPALAVSAGGVTTFGARLADLNGDGRLDLVWLRAATQTGDYELVWALRSGAGFGATNSRALPWPVNTLPRFAVGDVNGDGRADLLATWTVFHTDTTLGVWHQDAGGSFAAPVLHVTGVNGQPLAVGDMDGDGRNDVVVAHSTARRIGVLLQAADGTLQAERTFESGYAYYDMDSLRLADVNGDGRLDVIARDQLLASRPIAGAWPLRAVAPSGQIDIRSRTRSAAISAPRPRATISPRSITRYWSAISAAKS